MKYNWLPSRGVVAFVIVPLFTIFSIWLIGYVREEQAERQARQELEFARTLDTAVSAYNKRDSDGDLLKDWEEFLYKTDINSPDTDGDGLDDYNEVLDPIRDPLVADSELGRTEATSTETDVIGDDPYYVYDESLTATEKFARDAVNTFAQLQGSGSLNTGVQEELIKKVSEGVDQREQKEAEYALEDISIAQENTPQAAGRYKSAFEGAVQPLEQIEENDLFLFARYTETSEQRFLDQMEANKLRYERFIDNALEITVPPEIAEVHLELINHVYVLKENISDMKNGEADPLGAMIAAGDYTSDEKALGTVIQALSLYFENN